MAADTAAWVVLLSVDDVEQRKGHQRRPSGPEWVGPSWHGNRRTSPDVLERKEVGPYWAGDHQEGEEEEFHKGALAVVGHLLEISIMRARPTRG